MQRVALGIVAALFCLADLPAQPPPQIPPGISVRVDLVRISVTVSDSRGNFIRRLAREDFRVLDQGVAQPIAYFAATEEPARILLLLEASPAVYLISQQHLFAAALLLDGLGPDDQVALATYSNASTLRADFSTNKNALRALLARPQFSLGSGELKLYDALAAALVWLGSGPGKKSIVLLSTGLDSGPLARWESLLPYLHTTDVTIYSVGLGGTLRHAGSPEGRKEKKKTTLLDVDAAEAFARADKVLAEVALLTGGRSFFPRRAEEFPAIYRQIATALRHQYSLGFNSDASGGAYRKIEIQLTGKSPAGSRNIYARKGYILPVR